LSDTKNLTIRSIWGANPCSMDACYTSHYWGWLFESFSHKVKLRQ